MLEATPDSPNPSSPVAPRQRRQDHGTPCCAASHLSIPTANPPSRRHGAAGGAAAPQGEVAGDERTVRKVALYLDSPALGVPFGSRDRLGVVGSWAHPQPTSSSIARHPDSLTFVPSCCSPQIRSRQPTFPPTPDRSGSLRQPHTILFLTVRIAVCRS